MKISRPTSEPDDTISDQLQRVKEILDDAENSACLNDWEAQFCDSLRDLVLEYSERTRMSARQWEAFERIEGKLNGT